MAKAGRGSDQFMMRLPEGLRDRIKAAAEQNGRSMNAEIVATLEGAYPNPQFLEELRFMDEIEDIQRRLEQLKAARFAEEVALARAEMKENDRIIERADEILKKRKK